jgi:serine/threonine protein kinase
MEMEMNDAPLRMYSFLSATRFENIELYKPSDEYYSAAREELPQSWEIVPKGFWTMCKPQAWAGIAHGWKIHLSSIPENAVETVKIAASILSKTSTAFKFCSDPRMLQMSLGKNWSRSQVGKFITIYPKDDVEFKNIIEHLHNVTRHLKGPYILTDRRYLNSNVVFYRYGAHASEHRVDPYGFRVPGFKLEDGSWHEDVRGPAYRSPPGIVDPFTPASDAEEVSTASIVIGEKYLIKGAIKFNATGGIYHGIDSSTNRKVLIREVRGLIGHLEKETPEDPAYVLKREAGILQKLAHTGYVPAFIDLFKEWENWFLVEEYIDSPTLWGQSMEFYFSEEFQKANFGLSRILRTIRSIANGIEAVHSCGIVLRDLTKTNVLVDAEGNIKFIDFEFAYDLNCAEKWVTGWTPGYASKEQRASQRPAFEEDYYAFGALILDLLTYCASGLDLGREAILDRKLKQVLQDLRLPIALYELVNGLLDQDGGKRWTIKRALEFVDQIDDVDVSATMFPARDELLKAEFPKQELRAKIEQVEIGLRNYLSASLDLTRDDRLWPSGPQLFLTNPVSIQFGATGIGWYLLRAKGYVQPEILDWIDKKSYSNQCPPGLYSGLGGVALFMLYAGRHDAGKEQLRRIGELGFDYPGLYFGLAGWGLINLHFWRETGETRYLESAIEVGNKLLKHAVESPAGIYWPTENKIFLGFGDGQSGIALFLDYLAAAAKDRTYIKYASSALDFDLAHSIQVAGRTTWRVHVRSKNNEPNLPHTRFGSAGIGTACIRHFRLTGEQKYKEAALDCAYTVRSRVTNKIWQDSGNAGFGEFWLDLAQLMSDDRYTNVAYYQAEAILSHALSFPEGVAFGGTDHYRICSDYGAGGAGIGIFLDRLLHGKTRLFMLDELFEGYDRSLNHRTVDGELVVCD